MLQVHNRRCIGKLLLMATAMAISTDNPDFSSLMGRGPVARSSGLIYNPWF